MDIWIIVAIITYWTFAVACAAVLASTADDVRGVVWCVGASAVWPLLAVIAIVGVPYLAIVTSAERIRTDLHNRKLLRKFDQWLKENPDV